LGADSSGNTASTDAWTFQGRGLCQITGQANYAKFSVVSDPDRRRFGDPATGG